MRKKNNQHWRGFTLIETLVAIAIFLIGIQATVLLFSKTIKSKAYSMEMGRSSFIIARSMGDLTQYLRRARQSDAGSYPIVSADDNDLVIYSDYNKDNITERLHIYFSNGNIYMGVRTPGSSFPVTYAQGDESVKILASNIIKGLISSLLVGSAPAKLSRGSRYNSIISLNRPSCLSK